MTTISYQLNTANTLTKITGFTGYYLNNVQYTNNGLKVTTAGDYLISCNSKTMLDYSGLEYYLTLNE